jgi:hypothetical protein
MNNEDDDPIGKALGLEPLENEKAIDVLEAKAHDDSAKNDFEHARTNLYEIIQNGQEAIFRLQEIANQSQHPRAFEVLAKLMDTTIAANEKLLDLQVKIRTIDTADTPTNAKAQHVHNNLFVGSTAELQKMIQDMNKK